MATPPMSFRVPPERRDAVREVVNAIKDDPALAAAVLDVIRRGPMEAGDGTHRNIGPFRDESAALTFLVGRLNAALRPEAIFLIGSRADGTAGADSDFDFLVVLPDDDAVTPDPFAAYAPVAGSGLGVDVVPCRLADFEAEREKPGTLAFAAAHGGRLLHARPGGRFRRRPRHKHGETRA